MAITLQGADADLTVTRPALPVGLQPPPMEEFRGHGDTIVTPDRKRPAYAAAFWLISPQGKGRHAIHVDQQGRVRPNVSIIPIHEGTPGVAISKRDERELDLEEFWIIMLSRGYVRVDHLKDAKGVVLGLPDLATRRGGDSFTEWCMGVLDEARLKQLHEELGRHEKGRGLLATWKPQVPGNVRKALRHPGRKEPARREADLAILKEAERKLEAIAAKVRAAAAPTPVPGPPAPEGEKAVASESKGRKKADPSASAEGEKAADQGKGVTHG